MSRSVDTRVVEMVFKSGDFATKAKQTISILDSMKQSMNFEGMNASLDNLSSSVKGFDMSPMGDAVEATTVKWGILQQAVSTVVTDITRKVESMGLKVAKALTIEGAMDGYAEYREKLVSIQAIVANVKDQGKTLNDVSDALNELNLYADRTIYNFQDMTSAIKKFTVAGVDLDQSVEAVKGIANVAAEVGASREDASSAMYMLSQAMATGYVSLYQWRSLERSGMGGSKFQKELLETARAHGIAVDAMIEKNGSFRDSLSKSKWLTNDILLETLSKYTDDFYQAALAEGKTAEEATKLAEAQWVAKGYTEKQAKAIVELGKEATDAATMIKDFKALIDTLKEAIGSGWAQTWEMIFGNIEESKALWTSVYRIIEPLINASTNARNAIIGEWKDDENGRALWVSSLLDLLRGGVEIIEGFKSAISKIIPPITTETLINVTKKFNKLSKAVKDFGDRFKEEVEIDSSIFGHPFAMIHESLKTIKEAFEPAISEFKIFKDKAIDAIKGIVDWLAFLGDKSSEYIVHGGVLKDFATTVANAFTWLLQKVEPVFDWITNRIEENKPQWVEWYENCTDYIQKFSEKWQTFKDRFKTASDIVTACIEGIKLAFEAVWGVVKGIAEAILGVLKQIAERVYDVLGIQEDINIGGIAAGIALLVYALVGAIRKLREFAKTFADLRIVEKVSNSISIFLDSLANALNNFAMRTKGLVLIEIASAIMILSMAIKNLTDIEDTQKIYDSLVVLSSGLLVLIGAFRMISTGMAGVRKGISFAAIGQLFVELSASLLIISYAIKLLSDIEWKDGLKAVAGIAIMLGMLIFTLKKISQLERAKKGVKNPEKTLLALAGSLLIISMAIRNLSTLSWGQMFMGITAMVLTLGALIGAVYLLKEMKVGGLQLSGLAIGLILMGAAFAALAIGLEVLSVVNLPALGMALTTLVAVLLVLGIAADKIGALDFIGISAGLLLASVAIIGISAALAVLSLMDFGKLLGSVVALSLMLLAIGVASEAIKPGKLALLGAALLAAAIGLMALSIPLFLLGNSFDKIMLGIAAFGVLMLAMKALSGMMTAIGAAALGILALSGAMAALAVAMTLLTIPLALMGVLLIPVLAGLMGFAATVLILTALSGLLLTLTPILLAASTGFTAFGLSLMSIGFGALMLAGSFALVMYTLDQMFGYFEQLFLKVKEWIANFKKEFGSIGGWVQAKINDFVDRILPNAGEKLKAGIKNMLGGVIQSILGFLGIHSPSTVFASIGDYCGQGLIQGLNGQQAGANEAGEGLGQSVLDGIAGSLGNISDIDLSDEFTNPTITPTLDLTEIQNGSGDIESMFGDLGFGGSLDFSGLSGLDAEAISGGFTSDQASSINSDLREIKAAVASQDEKQDKMQTSLESIMGFLEQNSNFKSDISSAVSGALNGTGVYMDGNKVGKLVTKSQQNAVRASGAR